MSKKPKVEVLELPGNLYNISFGENPETDRLLSMLQLTRDDFGRFRDIYVCDNSLQIVVYSRIGGNNKPDYAKVFVRLGMHPQIANAKDDDFDNTYHYTYFWVPETFAAEAAKLYKIQGGEPQSVHQKFEALQEEMLKMTPEQMDADPRFAPIRDMFKRMAGQ